MGLLQKNGGVFTPMKPESVISFLEKFAEKVFWKNDHMFENINTLEPHQDEEGVWRSSLHVNWPFDFKVWSESKVMSLAFHEACLRTAMKLKVKLDP